MSRKRPSKRLSWIEQWERERTIRALVGLDPHGVKVNPDDDGQWIASAPIQFDDSGKIKVPEIVPAELREFVQGLVKSQSETGDLDYKAIYMYLMKKRVNVGAAFVDF